MSIPIWLQIAIWLVWIYHVFLVTRDTYVIYQHNNNPLAIFRNGQVKRNAMGYRRLWIAGFGGVLWLSWNIFG